MITHAPLPEDAHPNLLRLYQAIGYYITSWSRVEELLYVIYFRATKLPEYLCAAEFFEIDSFAMRSKFTIFAVRSLYLKDKKKREYWETKIKSLNDYYQFRNFLAHNPVHEPQTRIEFAIQKAVTLTDYAVLPSFYHPKLKKGGWGIGEIAKRANKLEEIISSLTKEIARDFPETL